MRRGKRGNTEPFEIKTETFSIGGKQVRIKDKINGLVIDENVGWTGCKDGKDDEMFLTECDWDFSGMPVEDLIRLAWCNFKVEVRTKFFKKLVKEGGMDLFHERTGADSTVKVTEALNYDRGFQNEIEQQVKLGRINAVKALLDVGASKDAIIRSLVKQFKCTRDEAEDDYNIACDEM